MERSEHGASVVGTRAIIDGARNEVLVARDSLECIAKLVKEGSLDPTTGAGCAAFATYALGVGKRLDILDDVLEDLSRRICTMPCGSRGKDAE